MLAGYVVAAFDTTIAAIAAGAWLVATNPEEWAIVRADPEIVPNVVNEVLRLETPIQYFSRVTTRDVDLGEGVVIPEGARVMHGYGATNRDPRHYADPDRFDVRVARATSSPSLGRHACAGQGSRSSRPSPCSPRWRSTSSASSSPASRPGRSTTRPRLRERAGPDHLGQGVVVAARPGGVAVRPTGGPRPRRRCRWCCRSCRTAVERQAVDRPARRRTTAGDSGIRFGSCA